MMSSGNDTETRSLLHT